MNEVLLMLLPVGNSESAYASKISKFNFLHFLMQLCAVIIMLQTKVSYLIWKKSYEPSNFAFWHFKCEF